MFEIIGFMFVVGILLYFTVGSIGILILTLPKYTIGGAYNTNSDRFSALLFFCLVCICWYYMVDYSPFTVVMK